jgi:tetratricopeptide (TPR) repeat protein
MRKHLAATLLLFVCSLAAQTERPTAPLSAQDTKGAQPLAMHHSSLIAQHSTRAVVVGISDYQDVGIPDLQYAHRDAEGLVGWLKSPAGGSVPQENIVLLTNQKATNARISASLDWLIETASEGDQVVIYFSGHGDVETKTRSQLGFLLAWDSPPTNYKAGAYSIFYLQDIIATLSIDKKCRVTVVTDACHAGKLAGSAVGGTQATAQALAQQFANEVKIMSCQPNEFSLEGEQWGGGRGCFSYHLLDGLTGLADRNGDATVSLFEIGRYLEDKVPVETAPHPQMPMTVGERNALLANVDTGALAGLLKDKAGQPQTLATTGSKGLADGFLAVSDSLTQVLYKNFENALAAGNLLGSDSSADFFYKKLLENPALKPLHGLMRRNLAVALQDETQQALNALLADDPYETNHYIYNPAKYADYPRYLHRSIELLGEKHYMAADLRSKALYFEAYNLTQSLGAENTTLVFQDSIRPIAQGKLREAMSLDSVSGYLHHAYSLTFFNDGNPSTYDSILYWLEIANQHSPNWLLPYLELAFNHQGHPTKRGATESWMKSALNIKPNSYLVQERLSWFYQWKNQTDESLALSDKMIAERPELFNAYSTAGVTCIMRKEYERAERYFQKSLAINPSINNWAAYYSVGMLAKTRRQRQAVALADSIFNDPASMAHIRWLGLMFLQSGFRNNEEFEKANEVAMRAKEVETSIYHIAEAFFLKGVLQIKNGRYKEGRALLQMAVEKSDYNWTYLILQNQYNAVAADLEGNAMQADSFFQAAFRVEALDFLTVRIEHYHESLRKDYGRFLLRQNREAEALAQFQEILQEEPNSWRGYLCMAVFYARKGKEKEALDWLEKSFDRWLPVPELATDEPYFSKIKNTKRFKTLLTKHFPPGWEEK